MAETFEQYEKLRNRTKTTSWMTVEDKATAAMDMTELLISIFQRVTKFVEGYEKDIAPDMALSDRLKVHEDLRQQRRGKVIEMDCQNIDTASGEPQRAKLMLDDLKVLLDQFPQRNI